MAGRLQIQLNSGSSNKLVQVYQYIEKNSFIFDSKVKSRNGLANQLLDDYLSLLNKAWEENPEMLYSDFKKRVASHKRDHSLDELVKLERHNRDLMNMILYLLMDTNQSMVRRDMKSYEKLQSMFKNGGKENSIYAVLASLVYQDNQELFEKAHQQGENLL